MGISNYGSTIIGFEIATFAFATCATPGPVNIVATLSGAKNGIKNNIPFVLGATSGLSLVIIITGFGIGQLLKTNEILANSLILIGSGYMLYLAYMMSTSSTSIKAQDTSTQSPNFYQGAIVQIINPKAWLVSMSGTAMYLNATDYLIILALYVLIFFIICFAAVLFWVYLGSLMATKLKQNHLSIFNKLMASTLLILVVYNLFDTFFGYHS